MIDVEKKQERAYPPLGQMKNDAFDLRTEILEGDYREALARFPAGTFDLIVTSPPYADQRSKTYGGLKADKYVEWFIDRSGEFKRVLKPSGTFILNIKEKAEKGERHTYVLELILELRKQGWPRMERSAWHKRNRFPGSWRSGLIKVKRRPKNDTYER